MNVFIGSGDAIQILSEVQQFRVNTNTGKFHLPTHSGAHETLCGVMGVQEANSYETVEVDDSKEVQHNLCKNCYCYWRDEFPDGNGR